MKFYITYFYNIRFLKPNQIPMSTAMWEPRWFHKGPIKEFIDARGVYCGLRAQPFLLTKEALEESKSYHEMCRKNCPHLSKAPNCGFMKAYRHQLWTLNKTKVLNYFNDVAEMVQDTNHFEGEPEIVLLVYEKPETPCAERPVIVEWFRNNNIDIKEYESPGIHEISLF